MNPRNIVQFCTNIYNKYKNNQMRYESVRVQKLRHAEVAFRSSSSLSEAENYSLRCAKVLSLCARNSKTHLLSDFTPKWLSFLQVSHFIRIKGVLLGDLP